MHQNHDLIQNLFGKRASRLTLIFPTPNLSKLGFLDAARRSGTLQLLIRFNHDFIMPFRFRLASISLLVFLTSCGLPPQTPPPANETTLFTRLGGMEVISGAAAQIVESVSHDPRTKRSFAGLKLSTLKASVAQHLCSVTGGNCRYEGEPMPAAHTGLAITNEEFDIMGDYVDQAFRARGVSDKNRAELATLLGKMRPDVVGH